MKIRSIVTLFFFFCVVYSCYSQKVSSYYSHETECLGSDMDGTEKLKAWGTGRAKKDIIEDAKKNAIKDVLFKGVRNGKSSCSLIPLVVEANAQENHDKYFSKFFAKKRKYSKYVSLDKKLLPKIKNSKDSDVTYGIVLTVLRNKLKKRLIKNEVLEKFNQNKFDRRNKRFNRKNRKSKK